MDSPYQSGNTGASAGGGFGDDADNCCDPPAVGRLHAGWSNAAAAGRLRITPLATGLTILTIAADRLHAGWSNAAAAGRLRITPFATGWTILTIAATDFDDDLVVTVMTRTKIDTEMWVAL